LPLAPDPLERGQRSALARPRRCQRFVGEVTKALVHSLRSSFDIRNDETNSLLIRYPARQTKACFCRLVYEPCNKSDAFPPLICVSSPVVGNKVSTSGHVRVSAVWIFLRTRWHRQRKQQDRNSELRHRPPQRMSDTSLPSHTAPTAKLKIRTNTTTSEPGVQ
jgi:hypothetical protein